MRDNIKKKKMKSLKVFVFIKKVSYIFLILILVFLFSCQEKTDNIESPTIDEIIKREDLKEEDFDVNKYENNDIPFIFLEKLSRLRNYEKETIGETTAKALITYTQKINNLYVSINEEKHLITRSNSLLVNVYHEAYFDNDGVRYKEKENSDFVKISTDEYIDIYGYLPDSYMLEGFVLSSESVISITKLDSDYYKYEIVLNGEIGSSALKKQMVKYGDLSANPVFSSVVITITIKEDFTPITIELSSDYQVEYNVLGKVNCHQNYIVTYKFYE